MDDNPNWLLIVGLRQSLLMARATFSRFGGGIDPQIAREVDCAIMILVCSCERWMCARNAAWSANHAETIIEHERQRHNLHGSGKS